MKFDKAAKAIRQAGKRGVRMAADELLNRSVPLVPVESGDLQASGTVSTDGSRATVSYTSDSPPAAIMQHEDLTYKHAQGEAKFLEKPLNESAQDLLAIIAAELNKTLGG